MKKYIVCNKYGPMELCFHLIKSGLLMNGDFGTTFTTLQRARRAIARSLRYAESKGYAWGSKEEFAIWELKETP